MSYVQAVQPIQSLAPEVVVPAGYAAQPLGMHKAWGWGAFLLWFIVLAVLIWLILYSLKPGWVLNPGTNDVNGGKVLVASIIIALIIIFIIWIIKALAGGYNRGAQQYVVVQ